MSSTKSKNKRAAEEDPELDDAEEEQQESTPKTKEPKSKKKKKQEIEQEADDDMGGGDEEPEEEEEEEELSEELLAKQKKALTKKRKKAKLVGYRALSKQAGYTDGSGKDNLVPKGLDCLSSLLSVADAKRLMRFVPATPGAPGFEAAEFSKRMELFKHGVPESAARETQARCDAAMRAIMNQAVMRAVEAGKKTVTPAIMAAVLRPYASQMEFTCVTPPIGLVRYAQNSGILNSNESDTKEVLDEKKDWAANKKAYHEFMESEEKRKEAARKLKKEKNNTRDKAADVAMAEVAAS